MHAVNFLQDLAVVMIVAGLVTVIFHRFKQPVVLGYMKSVGLGGEGLKAALWLAAMVLSLPMLIATFRKLQALGLLVAETKVPQAAAGERTAAIRAIVAHVVPIAGTAALGLFVLVLSSALLPAFKVMVVLLVIVAFLAWLLWRSSIRIYSKAQIALQETFAQAPEPRPNASPAALPSMLREANLETIALAAHSPVVGKLIRELDRGNSVRDPFR